MIFGLLEVQVGRSRGMVGAHSGSPLELDCLWMMSGSGGIHYKIGHN